MAPRRCLFCAIVAGERPGHRVLDEEHAVGFLDVRPLFRGHTLLVPRRHVEVLADLPPADLGPYWATAQRLERAVVAATGAQGSLLLVNTVVSQSVPHLHLHVVPRSRGDGLRFWLGPRTRYADAADADATATTIRAAYQASGASGG